MAKLPKCCGCVNYDWKKLSCVIYKNKIPKDIFAEKQECDKYVLKVNEEDDNLPIAKGR